MRSRTNLVATVVVAGFATLPMPAAAYVRTVTEAGAPTAWDNANVTMEFSLGSSPPVLSAGGFLDAAQQAGAAWSDASLDGVDRCSSMNLTVESVSDVAGPVGMDYHNRLIFRQGGWCRDPLPAGSGCYDPSALALTTVFQLKNSGEILDADLEVNATDFTWGDFVGHPEQFEYNTQDFQGAITHEFGHVIGLDHTCFIPGGTFADGKLKPRPVDNHGNPVPDCSSPNLPATITDATMYVSVGSPSAEVDLRSLSPDDVQGDCDIYSVGKVGGCSCAVDPGHGSRAGALVLLAMAARFLRQRRRRAEQAGTPPAPDAPRRAR
jgi:MYXO-CTERM domain-containing protein